jgi:gliding motility-associated-like protein
VNLDHNDALCEGYIRKLNPGSFSSYLWQDGSTGSTYTVKDLGTYYVQVTDNHNCVGSDTTTITNILPLPSDFLPPDTALCSYSKITLRSSHSYSSYLWDNGSKTTNITIDKPGTYWLEVTDDNNCVGRDSIEITPKQCMVGVYVPTAFSPNQDYKNDIFRALVFGVVKKFELSVYNRWGQRVFYTTDFTKGWDGKVGGRDQQPDIFLWACRYQLEGGQETFDKGTLMLVR